MRDDQAHLLAAIADALEEAGIPYMVVGSVAGSFHGEPRTTVDIDIVIDPTAASLREFVATLPADDYYADENAAIEAFARHTSFNVIERSTGWKVDLLVRQDRPFSRMEFERRFVAPLFGRETPMATAEDVVIAKLEWAKLGESERQLRDVARILGVSDDGLDREYLSRWIGELDLGDMWRRALELAAQT